MVVMQVKIYLPEKDTCIGFYWWRDGLVEKISNTNIGGNIVFGWEGVQEIIGIAATMAFIMEFNQLLYALPEETFPKYDLFR